MHKHYQRIFKFLMCLLGLSCLVGCQKNMDMNILTINGEEIVFHYEEGQREETLIYEFHMSTQEIEISIPQGRIIHTWISQENPDGLKLIKNEMVKVYDTEKEGGPSPYLQTLVYQVVDADKLSEIVLKKVNIDDKYQDFKDVKSLYTLTIQCIQKQ